jgi:DNA-binding MltR family transcriptional regulator
MNSEQIGHIAVRFNEVFQSLKAESDRGCVLVVASMIEQILENYICRCLVPKVSSEDELLSRSGNKPISSFSAKINLAYRLGLIPREEHRIYHQLRELRNACAHNIDRQDFVANHFKDRTRNIIKIQLQPGKLCNL